MRGIAGWVMRWRGIGTLAFGLIVGLGGWIFRGEMAIQKVSAQGSRITALETEFALLRGQQQTDALRMAGVNRGICALLSKYEQQSADITCPDHLYRGAPR